MIEHPWYFVLGLWFSTAKHPWDITLMSEQQQRGAAVAMFCFRIGGLIMMAVGFNLV